MSHRKVHFSVPIDHIEYLDKQWESRSRRARNGTIWRRMAVDRQRFRDRIERTAEILDRILDFEFRQLIYRERFEHFVVPEAHEHKRVHLELQLTDDSGNSTPDIDTILDDNKTSCQLLENQVNIQQQQQQQQSNTAHTKRKKGRQRPRKKRGGKANKRKNEQRH